jgi:hypothetical protein
VLVKPTAAAKLVPVFINPRRFEALSLDCPAGVLSSVIELLQVFCGKENKKAKEADYRSRGTGRSF